MAKKYSVSEVSVSVAAVPINAGRGDGDFVRIEQAEETFFAKAGVDGEVTYYESKKKVTRVTLILMQTSDSNDFLSALHIGDVKSGAGAGIVPLMVKDGLGRSVCIDPESRITKLPDETYSQEPGTLEWVFICPSPDRFVGGN